MGRKGPLLTLLGGVALASVLIALDVRANSNTAKRDTAATASVRSAVPQPSLTTVTLPPPAPGASGSVAAQPSGSAAAGADRTTYAGYTAPGGSSIAIAVRDGVAIAYLCDGSKIEAWLRGTAAGGQLNLTGTHNSSLTATYAHGTASGQVTVGGKHWTFKARAVYPPSGLYRATAEVRSAKVEAGWIVINGRQVGMTNVNGTEAPAPQLDTATGTATVDGSVINAVPVDGTTGSGF